MEDKKEDRRWKVYVHTNKINQKRYIGITKRDPEKRWRHGEGYKQHEHFYAAIKKYGWDNFDHRVVFDNLTEQEAKNLETKLIQIFRTQSREYGYNITKGGDGHSCPAPNRIPVCQFTQDGDFVNEFPSLASAGKACGGKASSILKICKKEGISAYGYCWRYKFDCNDLKKVKEEIQLQQKRKWKGSGNPQSKKQVCQLDLNGNLINMFCSATSAGTSLNGNGSCISYACNNNAFAYGYRWMYAKDYQEFLDNKENFKFKKPKSDHILQFDASGNLLHEYSNIAEATKKSGISKRGIFYSSSTHGMSHGYFWRYKSDYDKVENLVDPRAKNKKPVCQFTNKGDFIARYSSAVEAQQKTGYKSSSCISSACMGKRKTSHGTIWKYEKDCALQKDGTYKLNETDITELVKEV